MTRPSVAIAHDYLTQRGGAERVVLAMLRAFPDAPVHTAFYEPAATFPEFRTKDVRPMPLNRFGALRRDHRRALPVLAQAFNRLHIEADVVVCSSSGWAHGVTASGTKLVYCHTPARWLYQSERYLERGSMAARVALRTLRGRLIGWDRRAAASADRYLTQSSEVQRRIRQCYGIDAALLPAPPAIEEASPREPMAGIDPGYLLCVSRLQPYKNVLAVARAVSSLPGERLVVVGTGPDLMELRALGAVNVRLVGAVSDPQLAWLYANCRMVVAAAYEDYGLTPLEAATFGRPCIALRWGGFIDTVVDGTTGTLVEEPSPEAIAAAISTSRQGLFDPEVIRRHAATYSIDRFLNELRAAVSSLTADVQ